MVVENAPGESAGVKFELAILPENGETVAYAQGAAVWCRPMRAPGKGGPGIS